MINYNTILTEKQQKYQVLSSAKNDRYEYLTGEEILPSDQTIITEQASFYIPISVKYLKNKNNWRTREKSSWSFKIFRTY